MVGKGGASTTIVEIEPIPEYVAKILFYHFQWSQQIRYFLVLDYNVLNLSGSLNHIMPLLFIDKLQWLL